MRCQHKITFAVATFGSSDVLERNFLSSPCIAEPHRHQILLQKDFASASLAYNEAIDKSVNDLMVFVHQDVVLPKHWVAQLIEALEILDVEDPDWGVLGCFGVSDKGNEFGFLFSPGAGYIGKPLSRPTAVRTLDELVLIFRRSTGLRFDEKLPHFHLYGTDICLRAAEAGLKNFVIPAFCIHNANHYLVLPREFYVCCAYIRRVWKHGLPIQTPCITITKLNIPVIVRQIQEIRLRWIGRAFLSPRLSDPKELLDQFETGGPQVHGSVL